MPGCKTLRVHYYAAFREAAGRSEEEVTSSATTAAELYDEMTLLHGFSFDRSILRAVVNNVIVPWTAPVRDGDVVVFLAPFAGG
ncbi:MAG TPA: MoaD/ThiS family protein [Spirochaetia bacterium]|nr:MoaD/ThiS family protein [Spirochaetia bacterium]